jgi:hypothetical protein
MSHFISWVHIDNLLLEHAVFFSKVQTCVFFFGKALIFLLYMCLYVCFALTTTNL